VLLADRNELGWRGIPERETKHMGITGSAEFVPEHVHHNYRFTDSYTKSKAKRAVAAANIGQFKQGLSNPNYW
jgi:hypothetical protein